MINLTINDQKITVPAGTTVLDAAKKLNINIPTLCNHPDLCVAGNCRVCLVEQKGVKFNGVVVENPSDHLEGEGVLQVGKRHFIRIC